MSSSGRDHNRHPREYDRERVPRLRDSSFGKPEICGDAQMKIEKMVRYRTPRHDRSSSQLLEYGSEVIARRSYGEWSASLQNGTKRRETVPGRILSGIPQTYPWRRFDWCYNQMKWRTLPPVADGASNLVVREESTYCSSKTDLSYPRYFVLIRNHPSALLPDVRA